MKVSISVVKNEDKIPQIMNGASANTMFYLINYENRNLKSIKTYDNDIWLALPHDCDDFSRCVLVSNVFKWSDVDIKKAIQTSKKLGLPGNFTTFLEYFLSYKDRFEKGKKEYVESWLNQLHSEDK